MEYGTDSYLEWQINALLKWLFIFIKFPVWNAVKAIKV